MAACTSVHPLSGCLGGVGLGVWWRCHAVVWQGGGVTLRDGVPCRSAWVSDSPCHSPQDCSVLAFVLDHLLPHTQNAEDKDTPALARLFLASLAAAGSGTDAQVALVNEVKAALGRALAMAESTEKHARWGTQGHHGDTAVLLRGYHGCTVTGLMCSLWG